jgi:hypothetical protein
MRSIRVFSIASVLGPTVLAAACGGAATSNLLGSGDGGGNGSSSGGHSGSSSGVGSSSGTSSSSSGGSGSGSGGQLDSGGPMDSSGGQMDTGSDDGPMMVDSGFGDSGIVCGNNVYCDPQSQECCITGMGNLEMHMCTSQGGTCAGTPMSCDKTADCPMNQFCCGQLDQTETSYLQVSCLSDCSMYDQGQRQFCDPAVNDCPQQYPTCGASTILPGYHACR